MKFIRISLVAKLDHFVLQQYIIMTLIKFRKLFFFFSRADAPGDTCLDESAFLLANEERNALIRKEEKTRLQVAYT